jgi:hypothetical protein
MDILSIIAITTNLFLPDTGQDVTYSSSTASDVYMATSVSDQGSLNYTDYFHPCNNNLYIGTTVSAAQTSTQVDQVSNSMLNSSWTENFNSTISNYKVIAKNVSVTVPAGTFSCDKITYQQNGAANVDTIFWNSSVGNVKYNGVFLAYEALYKNF